MRPIHLANLDKTRPVLVLTRAHVRPLLAQVSIAPITSRIRGIPSEVLVGRPNGLDADSVVNCDQILTVPVEALGRQIGALLPHQESDLRQAVLAAYDLDV